MAAAVTRVMALPLVRGRPRRAGLATDEPDAPLTEYRVIDR
ncbi:hypothetical protein [Streptomyces sp. PT12]|nr:hypothetical protein [Streptomyces sp. PT12]